MRLDHLPGEVHLTYCTNVHGGETWSEVHASLNALYPGSRPRFRPMSRGLELRLSAAAAWESSTVAAFAQLRDFLAAHDLYVFTINAFPCGSFHGTRVKGHVYQPNWLTRMTKKLIRDIEGACSTPSPSSAVSA
jgi:hypothetical protein